MMGTSHEFLPNNTIQGRDLKKGVVNKSAANYSNKTETKFSQTIYGWDYQIFVLNVINFDKSKKCLTVTDRRIHASRYFPKKKLCLT